MGSSGRSERRCVILGLQRLPEDRTQRLSAEEAGLYKEWIANDRRMRKVIQKMRGAAEKAEEVLVTQVRDRG